MNNHQPVARTPVALLISLFGTMSRMSFSDWLRFCLKLLTIIYATVLAVLLFAADKLHVNIQQTEATFVVLVAAFFLYFDQRLSTIAKNTTLAPQILHMREAFDIALSHFPHAKTIRIYGSTTQLMVQWFEGICRRDESVHIKDCLIMAHAFSEKDFPSVHHHYNLIRDDSVKKWESFISEGHLETVSVALSPVVPQNYLIVIDNKVVISGLYTLRDGPTALLDLKAFLLFATSDTERAIIENYIRWFDTWFTDAKNGLDVDLEKATK